VASLGGARAPERVLRTELLLVPVLIVKVVQLAPGQ
jgi:hypothetical protein